MKFQLDGNVTDQNDVPVAGALIYVYDLDGDLAPLLDDADQEAQNPVVSGEDGYFSTFVTEEGFYTLRYIWAGRERFVQANVIAGRSPVLRVETAAAFAEEFSGPAYGSVASGEAATTEGQFFRVPIGTTPETYTRYQRTSGGSVLAAPLATTASLSAAAPGLGADLLGFISSYGGAAPRTMREKAEDMLSVKDFGAQGDDAADDIEALEAAVAGVQEAGGGILWFPKGTYRISRKLVIDRASDIVFYGDGATIRGLEDDERLPGFYFEFWGCRNIGVEGFIFDHLQPTLPEYVAADYDDTFNGGIAFRDVPAGEAGAGTAGRGFIVRHCTFNNLYTLSVWGIASNDALVEDCEFNCGVSTNDQWLQFVHFQTFGGKIDVRGNRFLNANPGTGATAPDHCPAAVYGSGITGSLTISFNRTEYCGRNNAGTHRLAVFDLYADGQNVRVLCNEVMHSMGQHMRLSSTRNGMIAFNRFVKGLYAELDYSGLTVESIDLGGTQKGAQDNSVIFNTFEDPNAKDAYTVGILSFDWGLPSTNTKVMNNSFTGAKRAVYSAGPFIDLAVEGNHARKCESLLEIAHNPNIAATLGTEAASEFSGLSAVRNYLINSSGAARNGITFNLNKTPTYTGTVGDIEIARNRIVVTAATAPVASGVSVLVAASVLQGRLYVDGNTINKYAYGVYPRNCREAYLRDNRLLNITTDMFLLDGSNGTVQRRGNVKTERLTGVETLVAGVKEVATNEINAGDTVLVNRLARSGTIGLLDVVVDAPNNKFTVYSRDAAGTTQTSDTSTFFFEIVH